MSELSPLYSSFFFLVYGVAWLCLRRSYCVEVVEKNHQQTRDRIPHEATMQENGWSRVEKWTGSQQHPGV